MLFGVICAALCVTCQDVSDSKHATAVMLWSRLTVPLHRYVALYILIFCRIGCLDHPLGTDEPAWKRHKKKKCN